MKTIELTETELDVLTDTLISSCDELRTEIGRTDRRELHAELKQRVIVLEQLLQRLKG
ncbi:hypothetical protein GURASL_16920 [Geotalea uraniireducens]|uniref:Uncharacterized protein n=1 Tax=Geotalea uraniireducens TaxID=351604 RepID=A0ABN6VQZ0_9BACT|nr:hypothetical protein [Geotalea uraniireducens]BDV42769.1 hypothetical protein GURASL_16920 [Geotalea uraniireducens]